MVFGICLVQGLQLVCLSRTFCKYLVQNNDGEQELPGNAITWEDFVETFPKKAEHMKNPEMREHCDYEQVSLRTVIATEDYFTIDTKMKNESFHPPVEPSREMFNELAETVLMNHHVEDLRASFKSGFRSVVSCNISELFSAQDIQCLLQGSKEIDVNDWKQNTVYQDCTCHHKVVTLFWKALASLSQEELQSFCEFATGQPTPPSGGFFDLVPLFRVKLSRGASGIVSRTCFNLIELPDQAHEYSVVRHLVMSGITQGKKQLFNIA